MPLFDFICNDCKKEFEVLVMGSDRPFCPKCGSDNLHKQMSTFAVRGGGKSSSSEGGASKCAGCPGGNCSTC